MSKRLSKRKQRQVQDLQTLNSYSSNEEELEEDHEGAPPASLNAFAALGDDGEEKEEGEEGESDEPTVSLKKGKKKNKKNRKKEKKTDPFAGLDEVDRALAELKLQYGEDQVARVTQSGGSSAATRSNIAFRSLLSVDPKNLDADVELRRFFGSKVITAASASNKHRPGPSSKLRYTISKPKPQYPPATSLAGLVMREMTDEEVIELYERKESERLDTGERWFTFEHVGVWREVERQFMGAVQSHDPNQLMALLQIYPWHVDTLLQLSEVYRLQSDIGAASDYVERALYAIDRCLIPTFNIVSGASRVDFDRVENRPMFIALHRIISYLGRRGCWVTAFSFAKLLLALDPERDPHGASFWLDFLAIKSGNASWLLSMLEQGDTNPAAASWFAYPGMAYAKALALRAEEERTKSQDHTKSDEALKEAITDFPQAVIPLADKIGASLPGGIRNEVLFQVEAGYSESPSNVIHLLSQIYASRSESLWKDGDRVTWFESQLPIALANLHSETSRLARDDILALIQAPRDPVDESINVPLFICRHVMCTESTSWLGFLPPLVVSRPFNSFDPLPPTTAISAYDNMYFAGIRPSRRGLDRGMEDGAGGAWRLMDTFFQQVFDIVQQNPDNWRQQAEDIWAQMARENDIRRIPENERNVMFEQLMQLAENVADGLRAQRTGNGIMPGGFPGIMDNEDET
ncbi:uncharacterized protein L203_104982 [Cryptococcus depauperatus CBS 7841]|uniref:Uncharacterized protein n=1 Tax=Cryptococcus depauperatus CBS 7841 TaxID=1295531 RepID=A0A1E3I169_9TREE|nr:cytoplasmic protein [Cryptococcus depauperatus CBS 7841]